MDLNNENNLLAEYHIRYGGNDGIDYYHVSDTYIALFSHFIPCGVWEAVYILDGLLQNQAAIQPDTIHGDTQAQSATVFALAYLLGITLMPRIRNWKDLTFFRPSQSSRYQHVDALFSDTVDWGMIETYLPDTLRVALSVKAGRIQASTVLRKLGTNSTKHKLYQAFHSLGCAVRTSSNISTTHSYTRHLVCRRDELVVSPTISQRRTTTGDHSSSNQQVSVPLRGSGYESVWNVWVDKK